MLFLMGLYRGECIPECVSMLSGRRTISALRLTFPRQAGSSMAHDNQICRKN